MWDVIKSEETFRVNVWINHYEQRDLNTCFVSLLSNNVDPEHFFSTNVDREEFLTFVAASVQLTLIYDT